jgi:hypothetical protein
MGKMNLYRLVDEILTGLSIGMIETVFVELDESTPRFDEWKW